MGADQDRLRQYVITIAGDNEGPNEQIVIKATREEEYESETSVLTTLWLFENDRRVGVIRNVVRWWIDDDWPN